MKFLEHRALLGVRDTDAGIVNVDPQPRAAAVEPKAAKPVKAPKSPKQKPGPRGPIGPIITPGPA